MTLTAPCDWPTPSCPNCDNDCASPSQLDSLNEWAISDLWAATGKVFGTCPVSVFPCNNNAVICGSCNQAFRQCGCWTVSEVKLPGPVASVTEVVVNGVTLDSTAYRIDDYEWLVRLDGGSWPTNADPIDPDSFRVDYNRGITPPAGAANVAGLLVCSRSPCNNSGCKIPKNTTQLTRQGVAMVRGINSQTSRPWYTYPETVSIFGIDAVDQWVRNVNAPTHAGAVHSPDLPYVRQTTWEAAVSP